MQQIDIDQTKNQIDELLQAALNGDEIIITQDSEPVLKLVRVDATAKRRRSGSARGLIKMADDFDEPLEDFREYM